MSGSETVAPGTLLIDVDFKGQAQVIAACVLTGNGRASIIDPGPSSTLPALRKGLQQNGIKLTDVDNILLTHIHLDHAGATGTLVRESPDIRVYVHSRGAPHMVDPHKLIQSATRLYGDDMDRLWGEFAAVPAGNVTALNGGERIEVSGRRIEVAYTPGHASHHVSYFDPSTGLAFVGDTAGIRIAGAPYVQPPTPPPDIDPDLWDASIQTIQAWQPERLYLTHFGTANGVADHLAELRDRLREWSGWVRASLDEPGTDDERAARFATRVGIDLRRKLAEEKAGHYETGGPPMQCWFGLARYWRKRMESGGDGPTARRPDGP